MPSSLCCLLSLLRSSFSSLGLAVLGGEIMEAHRQWGFAVLHLVPILTSHQRRDHGHSASMATTPVIGTNAASRTPPRAGRRLPARPLLACLKPSGRRPRRRQAPAPPAPA